MRLTLRPCFIIRLLLLPVRDLAVVLYISKVAPAQRVILDQLCSIEARYNRVGGCSLLDRVPVTTSVRFRRHAVQRPITRITAEHEGYDISTAR